MKIIRSTFLLLIVFVCSLNAQNADTYQSLTTLFKEWRTFENPPKHEKAPDYRKSTFESRQPKFLSLKLRLSSIDTTGWSIPQKVDYNLVLAEMNGYDFNLRVLRPWERDPAYYNVIWTARSDVPGHEGPTNHGVLELWQYDFPLAGDQRQKFLNEISIIPAFYEQAKTNLTGNARDLWIAGIRDIKSQVGVIDQIFQLDGMDGDSMVIKALNEAKKATIDLISWLESQSSSKTGPSGIGKENYTWYLQKVHLVPLTWEDEVMILKRELARAWSTLKFEEHRNRKLPQLKAADSPAVYNKMADEAAKSLMSFLEDEDIVTVKDYFDPALREHLGQFVPKERRNFFYITSHYDPRPLFSHFYHWFELARMDLEPNPSEIRRGALLYNIFDSRNEGMATAVEEMFMHAGLYNDSPRSRDMIAQRAARGLGSLYAHANEMTMKEVGGIHSEYTPRGWMKTEKELLIFEQHLYLRQPGYGTSYITGKYLMEVAMAEYARKLEAEQKEFSVKDFFDKINLIGNIPTSLGQWELTSQESVY